MATDQDLEVYLKADSSGLKTGMEEGAKAVDDSTKGIEAAIKELTSTITAMNEQMVGSFSGVSSKVRAEGAKVEAETLNLAESFSGALKGALTGLQAPGSQLGEMFEFIAGNLKMIGGVVAGGVAFKEAISETNSWNAEAMKLSKQLGVTTADATGLMVATHKFGIDADTLVQATQKISMQLMKGGHGFEEMGIHVKEASGEFKPAIDIIEETNEKIKAINDPILRNQAGMSAYGKSWAEMQPLLKLTSEQFEEAKQKAQELGIVVSPEQAANTRQYKEAMNEFKLALEAISINIGEAVLPLFTKLISTFADVAAFVVSALKPAFELLGFVAQTAWDVLAAFGAFCKDVFLTVIMALAQVSNDVFGNSMPSDINYVAGILNAFKTFFAGFGTGVKEILEVVSLAVHLVADYFVEFARIVNAALHLDWGGIQAAVSAGTTAIANDLESSMNRMVKIAQDGNQQIVDIWMGTKKKLGAEAAERPPSPQYDFTKGQKDKKPKSEMGQFEAELAEKKAAYQEEQRLEGSFREFSKEQELAFWEEKLGVVSKGSDDEKAIRIKVANDKLSIDKAAFEAEMAQLSAREAAYKNNFTAKLTIAQQEADAMKKAYGEDSKQYQDAQKHIVEIKRQAAAQDLAVEEQRQKQVESMRSAEIDAEEARSNLLTSLHMQSTQQELANEQDFENQRYAIKEEALRKTLALAEKDFDKNPVKVAELNAQLEALETQHQQKLQSIRDKATVDQLKGFTDVFNALQSGIQKNITAVLEGTETMGQALRSIMTDVVSGIISSFAQMLAQWVTTQVSMLVLGKTTALSNVMSNAATAGAAATASAAAIPLVGWMLAPGAGAEAFAAASSYATVASAAGGFDIPQGVNPLTQLHENEMVLPSKHADTIRNLGDQGGAQQAPTNITIQALDAPSVKKLFMDNGSALVTALQKQNRYGSLKPA